MYRTSRQPAWHRDVVWASAMLLAFTTLAWLCLFSLAQLSSPKSGESMQRELLRLALKPPGAEGAIQVRTASGYVPGEPFVLYPGLNLTATPGELPTLSSREALERAGAEMTATLLAEGSGALLGLVTDGALADQLELSLAGPARELLGAALSTAMVGGGLDDGTRLANWPAQAAANPGQDVQPLVGVFVTLPPSELQGLTNREIGAAVITELVQDVMEGGLEAATAKVTNENVLARLRRGVDDVGRSALEGLFVVLLSGKEQQVSERLEEAKAASAGVTPTAQSGLTGILSEAELTGLSEEQAEQHALEALARVTYSSGAQLGAAQLSDAEQARRLLLSERPLDLFGSETHGLSVTLSWVTGAFAILLLALLVGFSRGLTRLSNPGITLLAGAGTGALILLLINRALPADPGAPGGLASEGAFGALFSLLAYMLGALPAELLTLPLRNHLVLGGVGAALLLVALLALLFRSVRPRRRRFR